MSRQFHVQTGSAERLGDEGEPNENPLDWLLGRQALFLDGTLLTPGGVAAPNPGGIYADGLFSNSNVNGYSSVPGAVGTRLDSGLTDYAWAALEYKHRHPPPQPESGEQHWRWLAVLEAVAESLTGASRLAASELAYENIAMGIATYVRDRLLANPTPPDTYETWQLAQAHAILNEGVSDFAIEFAADMYGGIDSGGNQTANKAARAEPGTVSSEPGDFLPDGQIDTDRQGNIAWYGWAGTRGGTFVGLTDSRSRPRLGVRIFAPADGYHPMVPIDTLMPSERPGGRGVCLAARPLRSRCVRHQQRQLDPRDIEHHLRP